MPSGATKNLLKTINFCVTNAAVPLPDELLEAIQALLDKHETIEDSDSQRLHEELLAIYHKDIQLKPNRYSFFLALLRNLRPVLKGKRLLEWWDLLYLNIFDSLTEEKGLANEAQSILLEILVYDEDGEGNDTEAAKISGALFKKLVKLWLDSCNATATQDLATHLIKSQIQHVLISFGRKRTKEFLNGINELFVQKRYRLQVLPLLCKFISYQPPHLYELLQTELFNNLLRCLTTDTSTTVVSLAISALVMFLPHIPFSMSKHLPSLFNIYSRLLFWDRQCNSETQDDGSGSPLEKIADFHSKTSNEDTSWEKLSYSFETDDSKVPELLQYFTFLYGLYPINFMEYVRKPQLYLRRHANYPEAEKVNIEPLEIRQRSEPFRQLHLLHPNFFNMTIESELADANRFIKIDAPDIITNCMGLCTPMYAIVENPVIPESQGSRPLDQSDDDIPDIPLLDRQEDGATEEESQNRGLQGARNTAVRSSYENTSTPKLMHKASIANTSATGFGSPLLVPQEDSPTLGAHMRPPGSRTSLQDMLISQKNLRGSVYQSLPNDSSYSVASSNMNQEKNPSVDYQLQPLETKSFNSKSPSLQPSAPNSGDYVASLQREIMLLKNDLNFERYLKQQHLSHIGQLRRKHVREAVVEAETQHLINSNRSLKNKLEEAKRSNLQIKREAEKGRSHWKKWEADLTSKLRFLRAEQKKWSTEGDILRHDLELAQENCKRLRLLVKAGEAKELLSKQQVESMKHIIEENERLKLDLETHAILLRQFEIHESENDLAKENEAMAWTKIDLLNTKLQARDAEMDEAKKYYDAQIEDLRLKLDEATQDPRRQLKGFQSMVDSALAASRIKISELQIAQTKLLKRYGKLEYKYLKLQEEHQNMELDQPHQEHHSTTPIRRTHAISDPDVEPSLPGSPPAGPPTLSSSFPERPKHHGVSGHSPPSMRLNTSTSPSSPSNMRSFSDRLNLGLHDSTMRTANKSKGSSDGQSSAEMDSSGAHRTQSQSEVRLYGRGGIQNIGKPRKEKKLLDSDGGEASGSDRKDKKKKGGGGLKGIRGFV